MDGSAVVCFYCRRCHTSWRVESDLEICSECGEQRFPKCEDYDKWQRAVELYHSTQNDLNVVLSDPLALSQIRQPMPEVVRCAVRKHGYALKFAPVAFQDNKSVVVEAVHSYGIALRFASDRLRQDLDVIVAATVSCCHAIEYAHSSVKLDSELKGRLVAANRHAVHYI